MRASRENKSEDSHEGGVLMYDSLRNGHSSRQEHEMPRRDLEIYERLLKRWKLSYYQVGTELRGECHYLHC